MNFPKDKIMSSKFIVFSIILLKSKTLIINYWLYIFIENLYNKNILNNKYYHKYVNYIYIN